MKSGFSLIELLASMLIAALIALSLYAVVKQVRRGVSIIVTTIETDLPSIALYRQLERDVTGMFAPESSLKAMYAELDKKSSQKEVQKADQDNQEKKSEHKTSEHKIHESEENQEKKEKKIDRVFYFERESGNFTWSFITTGGIQTLDSKGNIQSMAYIRRVAYILQPNGDLPGVYKLLYRYDTTNLDSEVIKSAQFKPSYELASTIKHLSLEFTLFEPIKEGEQKNQKPTLAKIAIWQEQEIIQKYKTLIPAYVHVKGSFSDNAGKGDYPFSFMFKVYSYQLYAPKKIQQKTSKQDQAVEILKDTKKPVVNRLTEFLGEKFTNSNEKNMKPENSNKINKN